MKDFTLNVYKNLLNSFINNGFKFQTLSHFIQNQENDKIVILRHDVDRLPVNAYKMAQIESNMGINASYYFRMDPCSYNIELIKLIADLGHEIGYHYETMDTCNGNIDNAYDEFCRNLNIFRNIVSINTICMHGSPLSRFDNRDMWKKYDYKTLGLIGEPYFDINFSKVFYITDTGRKWNNQSSNVRDKVNRLFEIQIKSTNNIIKLIEQGKLPDYVMINTHPQRWFNGGFGWYKEFLGQNFKNVIKYIILKIRK
jgi:hypothetical protein